ncbi:MAG: helix-turn-helix transcriptional regulator [Olegusella sp.]|nr:helix-turn-helix transcriptional regulator [Olegusella sp.]
MSPTILDFCERLTKGIASQFGNDCEVVVHDLEHLDTSPSTIVAIENGHVTGRDIGGSIAPEMAALLREDADKLGDQLAYLNKTSDNRLIKSTVIFFRDPDGKPTAALSINYDITMLIAVERVLTEFTATSHPTHKVGEDGSVNISALLDELIDQSVAIVGKPIALMNKQDKIRAIGFLDKCGAFLITKSGQRVCKYFGISKYTLYSYLDAAKKLAEEEE